MGRKFCPPSGFVQQKIGFFYENEHSFNLKFLSNQEKSVFAIFPSNKAIYGNEIAHPLSRKVGNYLPLGIIHNHPCSFFLPFYVHESWKDQ
jgi:hypothetical protein